jgi:hypothetical protein
MRFGAGGNRKWNGLNVKRLGKVRVIIFENIFAIVVPVDLSSNVFGRWCNGDQIATTVEIFLALV